MAYLSLQRVLITLPHSVQLLSRVWLCDPMNRSTPDLPVHHQLPEFTQTHVHWVGDAIKPSLNLCRPLLLLPSIFPSIRAFSNESALRIRWPSIGVSDSSISPSNEYSYAIEFFIMAVSLDLLWQTLQAVCKGILLNLLMISHLECVQS